MSKQPVVIKWIDDYENDTADPQDGSGEPFVTWWDDMRPVEVRALVTTPPPKGRGF